VGIDLRAAVEDFENQLILQALERTGWNKQRAAQLLKVNRTTLFEMLKRKKLSA
jgi:DNA-binding NtrC family response regulator